MSGLLKQEPYARAREETPFYCTGVRHGHLVGLLLGCRDSGIAPRATCPQQVVERA